MICFQVPLTLSPVTGRRLDYTTFGTDIGVTDVTKNSRLLAVTSTTCSTLLLPGCCVCFDCFSTHRHPAHPVSVPIRHPRDNSSVVTSFERDIYNVASTTRCEANRRCTHHACAVRVVFLERGGGALGIVKSPVCTYNRPWTHVRFT